MLPSLFVAIAVAIGLAASHAHGTAPTLSGHVHVGVLDGSGGGPPAHP